MTHSDVVRKVVMDAATRSTTTRPRSGRAAPLSPPERRAAIVAAAIPLLRSQGLAITTSQIAEAAGVAEGTIFNVFSDKESLIAAAVEAALDPGPTVERLEAIDVDGPLEVRLVEAVRVLQGRLAEIWQLIVAVEGEGGRPIGARSEAPARYVAALEPLFARCTDHLCRSPNGAARALLAMTVGCSHPGVLDEAMPPEEIIDLFLQGVAIR